MMKAHLSLLVRYQQVVHSTKSRKLIVQTKQFSQYRSTFVLHPKESVKPYVI